MISIVRNLAGNTNLQILKLGNWNGGYAHDKLPVERWNGDWLFATHCGN